MIDQGPSLIFQAVVKRTALLALLLVAACQPTANRLLLLDLTLADPIDLESTAAPWHDAGYAVEYRRFFPHVTLQDLRRYHAVMVLGGQRPDAPSDALSTGDAVLLSAWVRSGGVVVLGYPTSALDRWTMNRWLAGVGAGLSITEARETAGAVTATPARRALSSVDITPISLGPSDPLRVRAASQALARGSSVFVGATRVGRGLVVVASRAALAAADTGGAREFLKTLARWTRRPAEWANVPPAVHPAFLSLEGGPDTVPPRIPRAAPPEGSSPFSLPLRQASASDSVVLPEWAARGGLRVLWAAAPGYRSAPDGRRRTLDSLTSLLDVGAFNAIAGPADAEAMAESTRYAPWERTVAQNIWKIMGDRLEETSVRWIPALEPDSFRLSPDTVGAPAHCLLDPAYWSGALTPGMVTLARLAAQHPDLVPAIALDLGRLPASTQPAATICDADFQAGLQAMVKDTVITPADAAALHGVPPAGRYDALLDRGLVDDLFAALERVTAARAAALRTAVLRIRPGLLFAVRSSAPPQDWFGRGLLKGWSGRGAPVILLTREPSSRRTDARYRERGIGVLSALELSPQTVGPSDWGPLRALAFRENSGFWLDVRFAKGENDSTWRLVRRLSREK